MLVVKADPKPTLPAAFWPWFSERLIFHKVSQLHRGAELQHLVTNSAAWFENLQALDERVRDRIGDPEIDKAPLATTEPVLHPATRRAGKT